MSEDGESIRDESFVATKLLLAFGQVFPAME
jgi:hypothetical protein